MKSLSSHINESFEAIDLDGMSIGPGLTKGQFGQPVTSHVQLQMGDKLIVVDKGEWRNSFEFLGYSEGIIQFLDYLGTKKEKITMGLSKFQSAIEAGHVRREL